MKLRGTVRAKLLTLVALPLVLMLAGLPGLAYLLDRQLIDEVDDRTVEAKKSLQAELDDDIAALTLTVRVLAVDPDLHRALKESDAASASALAHVFGSVYSDVQIIFADPAGNVLAGTGPLPHPASLSVIPELADLGAGTGELSTIARRGCAKAGVEIGPARLVAARAGTFGSVVVCQPLDQVYVTNAADKLGLELAVVSNGTSIAATSAFPKSAIATAHAAASLSEAGAVTYAVARFEPNWGKAKGANRGISVVAAIDVSDIKAIVRKNLLFSLGFLLLGGLSCLLVGARLAMIMSQSLNRISQGVRKLEQHEYVKVDIMQTGDELEDLATGFNTMVDGLRERDKLRSTMGKYMTASVMKHLLSGKVSLGGETIEVTILFTDIRSFTSISETMSAEALVALLNEYFSEMVSIVLAHDGAVDKYIGDAIMAVFGAPIPTAQDAENAVKAAVHMRRALSVLNASLEKRGIQPLRTGIGIHTGEVVAGNIGSEQRMEYTVIGDAVNLASRLESNTKEVGVDILISDATYERVKGIVKARPVREITVKGRAQPVMTYEVLDLS